MTSIDGSADRGLGDRPHADKGHLIVVDDDDRIRTLLKEFLGRQGYRVTTASGAEPAFRLIGHLDFDLLVLDVMMPGEDGFSLLGRIRSLGPPTGRIPVLLLTARGDGEDRINGLALGADDYLAKPFDPRELALRIEAILRRSGTRQDPQGPVQIGDARVDVERGLLEREGVTQKLTDAEIELFRVLLAANGEAVDRQRLLKDPGDPFGRAIDIQVTRLRRKLEPDPRNPRYLQTVRGVGYRLLRD